MYGCNTDAVRTEYGKNTDKLLRFQQFDQPADLLRRIPGIAALTWPSPPLQRAYPCGVIALR
jgi:hypothetical protein